MEIYPVDQFGIVKFVTLDLVKKMWLEVLYLYTSRPSILLQILLGMVRFSETIRTVFEYRNLYKKWTVPIYQFAIILKVLMYIGKELPATFF